jgi:hypothetical protein
MGSPLASSRRCSIGLKLSGSYDWEHLSETLPYLQERFIYTQAMASWRENSHDIARDILVQLKEELQ